MKVAVMNGIGEMGFVEREIPKPAAGSSAITTAVIILLVVTFDLI